MRKSDRVQELDLDERILWVDIEVDVDHNVEDDHQGEDHNVRSDRLDFADDIDGGQGDQDFKHLNVNCVDCVTSRVWSIQCLCVKLRGSLFILLQEVIENLEHTQYWVKNGRGPDEWHVVLDLSIWDRNLVILDLLVDIDELEIKLIDHGAVREVAATLSRLSSWDIDSV